MMVHFKNRNPYFCIPKHIIYADVTKRDKSLKLLKNTIIQNTFRFSYCLKQKLVVPTPGIEPGPLELIIMETYVKRITLI